MIRATSALAVSAALLATLSACGPSTPAKPPPVDAPDAAVPAAVDAGAPMAAAEDAGPPAPPAKVDDGFLLLVDLDAIPPMAPVAKPETFGKQINSGFKTFRKTKKECTGKGDALIEVDGGYDGPFTSPGAKETLYLVNITPCDAKLPPTHNLIVTQGTKVKVNAPVPENDIITVKDLDIDGDNEIFILNVTGNSVKARLVDTEDGKFEQLNDFGEIANGSCEGGKATGTSALVKYKKIETGVTYKVEPKPKACAGAAPAAAK
jgi:hypothetical protein